MGLEQQHCIPCEGDVPKMAGQDVERLLTEVRGWSRDGDWIERDFEFHDFQRALQFVNAVGKVAEAEGHHPDILLHGYRHVRLRLQTHAIGGLSQNDFILAAKIDALHD